MCVSGRVEVCNACVFLCAGLPPADAASQRPATSVLGHLHGDEEQPGTQNLLGSVRRGSLALTPDPAAPAVSLQDMQQLLREVDQTQGPHPQGEGGGDDGIAPGIE
jgi:hypothetical protein